MAARIPIRAIAVVAAIAAATPVIPVRARELPAILPDPDGKPGLSNRPLKIFILSGQSNMVGMGMADKLMPLATEAVFTKSDSPRALDPESLQSIAAEISPLPTSTVEDAQEALDLARRRADPNGLVCITGSLYLAGLLRPGLTARS